MGNITSIILGLGGRRKKTPQCYSGIIFELDASECIPLMEIYLPMSDIITKCL